MTHPAQAPLDDMAEWIAAYKTAIANAADWKATADRAKEQIVARLAEHSAEVGTVGGQAVVTYASVASTRFDVKKFRTEHPDLAEEFTVTTLSPRLTLTRRA